MMKFVSRVLHSLDTRQSPPLPALPRATAQVPSDHHRLRRRGPARRRPRRQHLRHSDRQLQQAQRICNGVPAQAQLALQARRGRSSLLPLTRRLLLVLLEQIARTRNAVKDVAWPLEPRGGCRRPAASRERGRAADLRRRAAAATAARGDPQRPVAALRMGALQRRVPGKRIAMPSLPNLLLRRQPETTRAQP